MGFASTATTTELIAKLTPFGRRQLLISTNSLITHFSVGDSDANYQVEDKLNTGEVPASSGEDNIDDLQLNSTASNVKIRSNVIFNNAGSLRKSVEVTSGQIATDETELGFKIISGESMTFNTIDRTETTGTANTLTNLFHSFELPITDDDKTKFTDLEDAEGGFKDTALSGFNVDKVLVIGIDKEEYGELIDGKTIKLELPTTAGTKTIYGTYQKTLTTSASQDKNRRETSIVADSFGNNIVFLFSDDVQKPNNDSAKSWATGYNTFKPFSVNKKEEFNYVEDTNNSLVRDESVGITYLDRGFIVITNQNFVTDFDSTSSSATTLSFNNIVTEVTQKVTCILDRNEFFTSKNRTFQTGDTVRISEIALQDTSGNIIAFAKTDRHIEKPKNGFLALGIKIKV